MVLRETLKALSEPNRLKIVEVLANKPRSVGELVIELKISQPLASKHLSALSKAGLVHVRQMSQRRIYLLKAKPFKEMSTWLEPYQQLWEARFDRLGKVLAEEKRKLQARKNEK